MPSRSGVARIAILGVSYKAGVGDLRESPALKIMHSLREQGAQLRYHDPYVPELAEFELDVGAARGCARGLRRRCDRHRPSGPRPRHGRRARAAHRGLPRCDNRQVCAATSCVSDGGAPLGSVLAVASAEWTRPRTSRPAGRIGPSYEPVDPGRPDPDARVAVGSPRRCARAARRGRAGGHRPPARRGHVHDAGAAHHGRRARASVSGVGRRGGRAVARPRELPRRRGGGWGRGMGRCSVERAPARARCSQCSPPPATRSCHRRLAIVDSHVAVVCRTAAHRPSCGRGRRLGVGTPMGKVGARERWRMALDPVPSRLPLRGFVEVAWGEGLRSSRYPWRARPATLVTSA